MDTKLLKSHYETLTRDRNRLFTFVIMPDGQILPTSGALSSKLDKIVDITPGSFNPLHDAHKFMFDFSKNPLSFFELSIHRIDKPVIEFDDLVERLKQFEWRGSVWVTNASLFYEKAGLIARNANPVFNIGYDTALRLVRCHGILGVQGINANFRVFRRTIGEQDLGLDSIAKEFGDYPRNMWGDIKLPADLSVISSTALRKDTK